MPWYDKTPSPKVWLCYEFDYARHIDYGLYLDHYDMSVIDYNTVTM